MAYIEENDRKAIKFSCLEDYIKEDNIVTNATFTVKNNAQNKWYRICPAFAWADAEPIDISEWSIGPDDTITGINVLIGAGRVVTKITGQGSIKIKFNTDTDCYVMMYKGSTWDYKWGGTGNKYGGRVGNKLHANKRDLIKRFGRFDCPFSIS